METPTTFDAFKQKIIDANSIEELLKIAQKLNEVAGSDDCELTNFEDSLIQYAIARRAEDIKQERGLN